MLSRPRPSTGIPGERLELSRFFPVVGLCCSKITHARKEKMMILIIIIDRIELASTWLTSLLPRVVKKGTSGRQGNRKSIEEGPCTLSVRDVDATQGLGGEENGMKIWILFVRRWERRFVYRDCRASSSFELVESGKALLPMSHILFESRSVWITFSSSMHPCLLDLECSFLRLVAKRGGGGGGAQDHQAVIYDCIHPRTTIWCYFLGCCDKLWPTHAGVATLGHTASRSGAGPS